MRCPRCRVENAEAAVLCVRCGAPLALGDEPAPRSLGRALQIDRRQLGPSPEPAWEMTPPADPTAGSGAALQAPASVQPAGETRPSARLWSQPATADRHLEPAVPAEPDEGFDAEIPVHVESIELHLRRAPSWKRAAAWAIDGLVLGLFGAGLFRLAAGGMRGSPEAGLDWAIALVALNARILAPLGAVLVLAAFVYFTLGHALMGATLGKLLVRIQVVTRDGQPPTISRSAVRSGFALTFLFVLGLGPLLALFTRSGRALHDFVAGTYAVELP